MNIVADESVETIIIQRLRDRGHQVLSIAEVAAGKIDEIVLDIANQSQAVLVTSDKDFGEMVFRHQLSHHGIVLVRLAGLSLELKADLVEQLFHSHESEISNAFCTLTPQQIRFRR